MSTLFINECGCVVDFDLLHRAVMWYDSEDAVFPKRISTTGGYPFLSIKKKNILVHRLIMMYLHDTKFNPWVCCHHIDEEKLNASSDNIKVLTRGEHNTIHLTGTKRSDETKKKMSRDRKGVKLSEERRKRMSEARKGIVFTDEHKRNMSIAAFKRYSL